MAETAKPESSNGSFAELLVFLGQETTGMRLGIIGSTLLTGLSRGGLLAIFNAAAASGNGRGPNLWYVAAFVAVLAVYLACGYVAGRLNDLLVRALIHRLRLRICAHIIAAPLRLIEMLEPGKIFTHIGHEVEHLGYTAKNFLNSFQSAVVVLFALIYMAWLSIPGFIIGLAIILLSASAYYWQERKAKLSYRRAREKEVEYFDAMYDLLHGFKEVKLGRAQQEHITGHLEEVGDEFRALGADSARLYQVSELTSQAFIFSLIAIFVFALPLLFPGNGTPVYKYLATVLFVLGPAEQLISNIPSFSQAAVALGNIRKLEQALGSDAEAGPPAPVHHRLAEFETIEFRDVHFEFRGAGPEESFDLGPINLTIRRGEMLFLCGGNGAGKTTLLKLLTGLYPPTGGAILVDGEVLDAAHAQEYRSLFAAVFSDVHLMRKLYGIYEPDPMTVRSLLETLQIADKVSLRDGAFSSTRLSTGQRKRLAFATAKLRERQIYVFDEFAADQDPAFRAFFYTVLLSNLKEQGKTIIAVTHDDRWFGAGDRLVRLEYGKIVADTA